LKSLFTSKKLLHASGFAFLHLLITLRPATSLHVNGAGGAGGGHVNVVLLAHAFASVASAAQSLYLYLFALFTSKKSSQASESAFLHLPTSCRPTRSLHVGGEGGGRAGGGDTGGGGDGEGGAVNHALKASMLPAQPFRKR